MKFYRAYTMDGLYLFGRITGPEHYRKLVNAVNVLGGCDGVPGLWNVYFARTMKELEL